MFSNGKIVSHNILVLFILWISILSADAYKSHLSTTNHTTTNENQNSSLAANVKTYSQQFPVNCTNVPVETFEALSFQNLSTDMYKLYWKAIISANPSKIKAMELRYLFNDLYNNISTSIAEYLIFFLALENRSFLFEDDYKLHLSVRNETMTNENRYSSLIANAQFYENCTTISEFRDIGRNNVQKLYFKAVLKYKWEDGKYIENKERFIGLYNNISASFAELLTSFLDLDHDYNRPNDEKEVSIVNSYLKLITVPILVIVILLLLTYIGYLRRKLYMRYSDSTQHLIKNNGFLPDTK